MNKITYICFILLLSAHNICGAQVQRVRIIFESPTGYIRPLLLGFDPTNTATDGVDYGWDVLMFDNIPGDLNYMIEGNRYVVQGVGEFEKNKRYPFGLFLTNPGTIRISLFSLENFELPIDVYIYDADLDNYTRINDVDYFSIMSSGDYLNKYYIAFYDPTVTLSLDENGLQEPEIKYLGNSKELYVNTHNNSHIKKITLYNLLGQEIFALQSINHSEIKIPVNTISANYLLVNIETEYGTLSKKILIH